MIEDEIVLFFLFIYFSPAEGVFPEGCGNPESTEPYPDKSPQLQYLQVRR